MGAPPADPGTNAECEDYRRKLCRLPPGRGVVISSPPIGLLDQGAQIVRGERRAVSDASEGPERRDLDGGDEGDGCGHDLIRHPAGHKADQPEN
jgi:hypothetical protein